MSWISLQANWAIASGHMNFPSKALAADECYYSFIPTNSTASDSPLEEYHPLYKISYMWYTALGFMITTTISLICSLFYGFNDPLTISPDLITPMLRKRIFKACQQAEVKSSSVTVKDTEF